MADGRVAQLDGIDGGAEEAPSARVARFGELPGSADNPAEGSVASTEHVETRGSSAEQGATAPADLGQIGGAGRAPARPVADLAAGSAQAGSGQISGEPGERQHADAGGPGPVALFDSESLGAGRADVSVAKLGTDALNRRSERGGGRVGRRQGGSAERGRSRGAGGVRAAGEPARGLDGSGDREEPADTETTRRGSRRRRVPSAEARARSISAPSRGQGRQELDPDADPVALAREICLRLLTDRARTRRELAQALRRKGVPDDAAQSVLERFDEVGLIDDAAFAGQWARSRHNHRGLARRAIAVELRRKGVSDEDAVEALAEVDTESEERKARELVERKLRSLAVGTAEQRAVAGRRLVGMLARKGYGAGIAYRVVKDALAERGAEVDELGDAEVSDD